MKFRNGFVTNSSSSSFVVQINNFKLQCNKCGSYNTTMVFEPEGETAYQATLKCNECNNREDMSDYED